MDYFLPSSKSRPGPMNFSRATPNSAAATILTPAPQSNPLVNSLIILAIICKRPV